MRARVVVLATLFAMAPLFGALSQTRDPTDRAWFRNYGKAPASIDRLERETRERLDREYNASTHGEVEQSPTDPCRVNPRLPQCDGGPPDKYKFDR
jgi:hypothetical protein